MFAVNFHYFRYWKNILSITQSLLNDMQVILLTFNEAEGLYKYGVYSILKDRLLVIYATSDQVTAFIRYSQLVARSTNEETNNVTN